MKTLSSLKFKIWIITGLFMAAPFCYAKEDTSLPIPKTDPSIPPITQPCCYPTFNPMESNFNGTELFN